jgi:hypothetical protein
LTPSARSRGPGASAIYISDAFRRQNIGQQLLVSVITHSGTWFDFLNTHAPPSAWPFYESLGFARFMMSRGSLIACSVRFKRGWRVKTACYSPDPLTHPHTCHDHNRFLRLLFAALLHASWNAIVKASGDKLYAAIGVSGSAALIARGLAFRTAALPGQRAVSGAFQRIAGGVHRAGGQNLSGLRYEPDLSADARHRAAAGGGD